MAMIKNELIIIIIIMTMSLSGCDQGSRSGNQDSVANSNNQNTITTGTLPMAIDGKGFFILRTPGRDDNVFTKLGNLFCNSEGYFINPQGYILQGWKLDQNGNDEGTIGDIRLQRWLGYPDQFDPEILIPVSVDADGIISARAADGNVYAVARIALSIFNAAFALEELPNHLYRSTDESGPAVTDHPGNIGLGSIVPDTIASDLSLDSENYIPPLAVIGQGYFAVAHATDPVTTMYTRSGSFVFDRNGFLVIPFKPYRVQGWPLDPTSEVHLGGLQDIKLQDFINAPLKTGNIELALVLDRARPSEVLAQELFHAWDGRNAGSMGPISPADYDFATAITVYDALGKLHVITVYFDRTTHDHEWEFLVTCAPSEDFRASYPGQKGAGAMMYGMINFDVAGDMTSLGCWNVPPDGNVDNDWNANRITLGVSENYYRFSCNFIENIGDDSIEFIFAPREGNAINVIYQDQDGHGTGFLLAMTVNAEGIMSGYYTNGLTLKLWQVVLAKFADENQLIPYETGIYLETPASGSALFDMPGSNGLGSIVSN